MKNVITLAGLLTLLVNSLAAQTTDVRRKGIGIPFPN